MGWVEYKLETLKLVEQMVKDKGFVFEDELIDFICYRGYGGKKAKEYLGILQRLKKIEYMPIQQGDVIIYGVITPGSKELWNEKRLAEKVGIKV
jgi:hypothetical protein